MSQSVTSVGRRSDVTQLPASISCNGATVIQTAQTTQMNPNATRVSQIESEPVNQLISPSISQSTSLSISQSICQPVNQSASQSISQSISQPVNQSVSQSHTLSH